MERENYFKPTTFNTAIRSALLRAVKELLSRLDLICRLYRLTDCSGSHGFTAISTYPKCFKITLDLPTQDVTHLLTLVEVPLETGVYFFLCILLSYVLKIQIYTVKSWHIRFYNICFPGIKTVRLRGNIFLSVLSKAWSKNALSLLSCCFYCFSVLQTLMLT